MGGVHIEIKEYTVYNETEILDLYKSVGWSAYTDQPDLLRKGFENSLLKLAAYDGDALAGIIRLVGDGHTIVFIQDVLVRPEMQRRGIGTSLIQDALKRFAHVRQIELATDDTTQLKCFYRSLGFTEMADVGCCGFMRIQP